MARRTMRAGASARKRGRQGADGPARRKRSRYLDGVTDISPDDYELLRKFVTEHGKIIPADDDQNLIDTNVTSVLRAQKERSSHIALWSQAPSLF